MIFGVSNGEGKNAQTQSSKVCTPLFLNEDPHSIGTTAICTVALRRALKTSSSVIVEGSSKYFSIKASSNSATFSSILSLHSLASSTKLAGISSTVQSAPIVSSCQQIAFILIRSTNPLKVSSAPIGITIGHGLAPKTSFIWRTTSKKSAPERSILLT